MSFSEDEVRRAAALRLKVESRVKQLEEELSLLRETLTLVDTVLKASAFKTAAELPREIPAASQPKSSVQEEYTETRALKKGKDGPIIANALISPSRVSIVPTSDTRLSQDTPPFKSFFMSRILEGMKAKDKELVTHGKLNSNNAITYELEEVAGSIKKITISNYREKTRLNEILSSASWVFTRMLEKK